MKVLKPSAACGILSWLLSDLFSSLQQSEHPQSSVPVTLADGQNVRLPMQVSPQLFSLLQTPKQGTLQSYIIPNTSRIKIRAIFTVLALFKVSR